MQETEHCDTLRKLTNAILSISQLPAAPTSDWSTAAAEALTPIFADATLGIVVGFHQPGSQIIEIESTGTHCPSCTPSDNDDARCGLERISSHTVTFPELQANALYIAPISRLLPQWFASKASLPWTSPQNHTIAAVGIISQQLPAGDQNSPNRDLVLITIAKPLSNQPFNLKALSAAFAALLEKAKTALIPSPSFHNSIPWLTQREQVILNHLIEGQSVREIADIVDRSQHTVHDHVKNLHKKLDASSRGQLIARAMGLTDTSVPIKLATPVIDDQLIRSEKTASGIAEYKSQQAAVSRTPNA